MSRSSATVCECRVWHRYELPLVAARVQRQLQHSICPYLVYLAVWPLCSCP